MKLEIILTSWIRNKPNVPDQRAQRISNGRSRLCV